MPRWKLLLNKGSCLFDSSILSLFVCFLMLSFFCFTFSADVSIKYFIDGFKQCKTLYEDVVLGAPLTSQYSPSVGEEHFLIYLFCTQNIS